MWVRYRAAKLRQPGSAPLSCAGSGLQLCYAHCGGAKKGGERTWTCLGHRVLGPPVADAGNTGNPGDR